MSDLPQTYDQVLRPIEARIVRSIWRIVRNQQDAEDAMQDALLIVLKRWDRIASHPCPQALVQKICIDAAYDVTRRRLRQRQIVGKSNGREAIAERSPLDRIAYMEQYNDVITAIHRLPRQQATAMLMRAIQGQSYHEIAAALGCTEATARKHIARSRQRLRVLLAHLAPTNPDEVDHERQRGYTH
jgi:RNA polymerase sigma-70 factor, ECF subfamily